MDNWQCFIKKILETYNVDLYLKGGAVIGIYLLKVISQKDNFEFLYHEYKKLNLIHDFDFMINDDRLKTDYFYYEFGKEYQITLHGKSKNKTSSLLVMRSSIHLNNKLFELCLSDSKELPMTGMKILITKDNVDDFFTLFENIHCVNISHLKFLKNIEIEIPPCDENGMFCNLSNNTHLLDVNNHLNNIILNTTSDKNHQLCLYYLIKNPSNLSRCQWKNVEKSNKIKKYYQHLDAYPRWLLNDITPLIDNFIHHLNNYINNIYLQYQKEINLLVIEINKYDLEMMINECLYDLSGIGGNPEDVLNFLYHNISTDSIVSSPRISKLNPTRKNKLINDVILIKTKCDKYNVTFKVGDEYPKLKMIAKNKRNELRMQLTELYEDMFLKINDVFINTSVLRWKNNIEMYKKSENKAAIHCLYDIFSFHIQLKLLDGSSIIDVKNISNNPIWQLILELYK